MRLLTFVFLLVLSLNAPAQSPTVSRLFADGTNHANAGRFDNALKSYKTALFVAENEYAGAFYRSRLHYNIGVCHFRLEQFDQATDRFKQAILLNNGYTRAHYALGMAQMRKKQWKGATASFTKALELEPKNGEAWFDLAFASIAVGDFETAETAFARSITFASVDSALSHNNIGVILAAKGDLAAAEIQFENAIAMSSGRLFEAKRNLEFCRAKRGGGRELIAWEYAIRNPGIVVG